MKQLLVKKRKFQLVLIILLGLFFVPAGVGLVISGVLGGMKLVPMMIGILMVIGFAAIALLFLRGDRQSVKYFSEQGLGRTDGREFSWSSLTRVVDKMAMRSGTKKTLWRTEIQFNDGSSAWIIPSKVANYDEVRTYVNGLQCEHTQEDA